MPHELPAPSGPPVTVDCGVGGRVTVPLSLSSFMSSGGVGAVEIDTSRSTIPIPDLHTLTLYKRNPAGAVVASQQFAATNINGKISIDAPAAADAFLINGPVPAAVDVIVAPFEAEQRPGENSAIFEVEVNGAVVYTQGQIWSVACGDPTYSSTGAPNACSANP